MTPAAASVIAGAVKLLTGVTVRWAGATPGVEPRVYFGNHTSHLDALLVWAALPLEVRLRTRPVGARDYWGGRAPHRSPLVRLFDAVLIDRSNPDAAQRDHQVQAMLSALGAGASLIMFPEGTRGPGPGVARFKSGLYHLAAQRPGLAFAPVHIDNAHRILPKGECLPVPLACRLTFGPALRREPGEPRDAFLERARAAVCGLGPGGLSP